MFLYVEDGCNPSEGTQVSTQSVVRVTRTKGASDLVLQKSDWCRSGCVRQVDGSLPIKRQQKMGEKK